MSKLNVVTNKIRAIAWKVRLGKRLETARIENFHKDTHFIISKNSKIKMGKNVYTSSNVHITACAGGIITMGESVFFNRNDIIICRDNISIGNHIAFGPNVTIYDHDHAFGVEGVINNEYKKGPIVIEDNCWIGANVTILRNTHIGEGCVIGAGAVVSGDIPPHSIVKANRQLTIKEIK